MPAVGRFVFSARHEYECACGSMRFLLLACFGRFGGFILCRVASGGGDVILCIKHKHVSIDKARIEVGGLLLYRI